MRTHHLSTLLVLLGALLLVGTARASIFTPTDSNAYPDNMTMVIELRNGTATVDTCEVAAFVGSECRGVAYATKGRYYLVIAGEGKEQQVEIATCLRGRIVTIDSSIDFVSDSNIGTSWEPYVIRLDSFFADVNSDGATDVADIATIITAMSSAASASESSFADVNGDGATDVADIAAVITAMANPQ